MKKDVWVVTGSEAGFTLAAFLRRHVEGLPWSRARSLCARGRVKVQEEVTSDPARRLVRGEVVAVDHAGGRPASAAVRIVYQDAHLVVIDKPPGLTSVPYEPGERGTALHLARAALGKKTLPLFVVHRIDKDTSGLLVLARTRFAESALARLFRAHDVERTYVAVVHGTLTDRRIESFLVADRGDGLRGSTRSPGEGKRAVTHVTAKEKLNGATLCAVRLETGKTHQIRIHLAENGHPLVGERVYIRDYQERGKAPLEASRLLLHAATLGFRHPVTGASVRLASPLPPDFEAELERLRQRPGARSKRAAEP